MLLRGNLQHLIEPSRRKVLQKEAIHLYENAAVVAARSGGDGGKLPNLLYKLLSLHLSSTENALGKVVASAAKPALHGKAEDANWGALRTAFLRPLLTVVRNDAEKAYILAWAVRYGKSKGDSN